MIRGITAVFDVTAANVIAVWYAAYFATLKNHSKLVQLIKLIT